MRVRVYWNFRRKEFSVQTKAPIGWRVVDHVDSITLHDAVFTVNNAGRQRVLRSGRKNVHAWVEGDVMQTQMFPIGGAVSVTYNPFRDPYFTSVMRGKIESAEVADFSLARDDDGIKPVILINNRRRFDVV